MKKYIGAVTGFLFFVGVLFIASNTLHSAEPETQFFDYDDFRSDYYNLPSMNLTADTLRNWTGVYWNYSNFNQYWVYVRNVSAVIVGHPSASDHFADVNITYDAYGNETEVWYNQTYDFSNRARLSLPGQKFAQYVSVYTNSTVKNVDEFLKLYGIYIAIPQLVSMMNSTSSRNSSSNYSNSSYNYSNTSYPRNNYTNSSPYYPTYNNYTNVLRNDSRDVLQPMKEIWNLYTPLPSRNFSLSYGDGMNINVYNASFIGNTTSYYGSGFSGRIEALFDLIYPQSGGIAFDYRQHVFFTASYSENFEIYSNSSLLVGPAYLSYYQRQNLIDHLVYFANISKPVIYNASNSNSSYNYTNSSSNYSNSSSNYTNSSSEYPICDDCKGVWGGYGLPRIYGSYNLSVQLASQNFTLNYGDRVQIYVYNASFIGNKTNGGNDYRGRMKAKFAFTWPQSGGYRMEHYEDVIFEVYHSDDAQIYSDSDLLTNESYFSNRTVRSVLIENLYYFFNSSRPAIFEAMNKNKTSPIYGQKLPYANITGYDLQNWTNSNWYEYRNYTGSDYRVIVNNATFQGNVSKNYVDGIIYLNFHAYGNNSNWRQIWEDNVDATIRFENSYVYVVNYSRPLNISTSDIGNFLRAYIVYIANPYLTRNSSSNTTIGIVFPEMNITGYDLNRWLPGSYYNYTAGGYWIAIYNIFSDLQAVNGDVNGTVYFNFTAYGNDTNDTSCRYYGQYCRHTYVETQASIYIYGVKNNNTDHYISLDRNLRIDAYDIQNFLEGYYTAALRPNITNYYNISSSNSSNTTTGIIFPTMNLTGYDLNRWLPGSYWNYTYSNYSITIYNVSSRLQAVNGDVNGSVYLSFVAYGNDTNDTNCRYYGRCQRTYVYSQAEIYFSGVKNNYTQPTFYQDWNTKVNASDIQNFLRAYYIGVMRPYIIEYYNVSTSNSSNTATGIIFPEMNITRYDLNRWLPDSYNYYTIGNYWVAIYNISSNLQTFNGDVNGTVYFNFTAFGNDTSNDSCRYNRQCRQIYNYSQGYIYIAGVKNDSSGRSGLQYSLGYNLKLNSSDIQDFLRAYYVAVMRPYITSYYNISSSNSSNTTTGIIFPEMNITGYDLNYWLPGYYSNYTAGNYWVAIYNISSRLQAVNGDVNGTVYFNFTAYGNDTNDTSCRYYGQYCRHTYVETQASIYIYGVKNNNTDHYISLDWNLNINSSDIRNFLRGYYMGVLRPNITNYYNISSSSNSSNTTGLVFPEMNLTGYDLNRWLPGWYSNYTYGNYSVSIYNVSSRLQAAYGDVNGTVTFNFVAYGNDTNDTSCRYNYGQYCRHTTVYSQAEIYISGVKSNNSQPRFYLDWNLRISSSDIQNFLIGYYVGVLVPNITTYYNISKYTNRTIYIPDLINNTQITIDCSNVDWRYCSGANSQSSIFFLGYSVYNMSINVNGSGNGSFNGMMQVPYVANLINFTNTYKGKETLIDNLQGNATLYISGYVYPQSSNPYYVQVRSDSYASVPTDRYYFVENALQRLYQDRINWYVQYYVNDYTRNSTR